jgi:Domain of unknown function (DUF4430)
MAVAGADAGLAATSGPSVTVQVKNGTKTLTNSVVHGEKGWVTKGGTPKGKCPGSSAAGALDAATHGKWAGKYSANVGGLFVTSIDGVKPKGLDYWAIYVNGKYSSVGVCLVKLRAGEKVLFKVAKG